MAIRVMVKGKAPRVFTKYDYKKPIDKVGAELVQKVREENPEEKELDELDEAEKEQRLRQADAKKLRKKVNI